MKTSAPKAFTLLELLVVIGLIAVFSFFLVGGLLGGGVTAALQSGQATMANLITAARTKASATGHKTRLLISIDQSVPERYLRFVVLQLARESGSSPVNWDTVTQVSLPDGVYVIPGALTQAAGLVANPADWKRVSTPSADLVSDLLSNQSLSIALDGEATVQNWTGIAFTSNFTLAALNGGVPPKGALIISLGFKRPPGSFLAGEAPVQLGNPQAVRGLILSAYGVPALLNDRSAF